MRVLVTGGGGFIGSYVVRDLLRLGHVPIVFDRDERRDTLKLVLDDEKDVSGLSFYVGEISDVERLIEVFNIEKVDCVVHLASPLTLDVDENPLVGIRDICVGTAAVFDAAVRCGVRRVVWSSSVAVFGPANLYPSGPLVTTSVQQPSSLYGCCKSLCEALAKHIAKTTQVDITGLRLTVVYGAGRKRGYMSYPSNMLRSAAANEPLVISVGSQCLSWQYVEEVSAMLLAPIITEQSGNGYSYNCYGDSKTYSDAGLIIRKLLPNLDIEIYEGFDPLLEGVVDDYDFSDFSQQFAYLPAWPLDRGIQATLRIHERNNARANERL